MKNILEYLPPTMPSTSFMIEDGQIYGIRTEKRQKKTGLISKCSEAVPDISAEEWQPGEEFDPVAGRVLLSLGNPDRATFLFPDVVFRMQILELENFPKNPEERDKVIMWQARRNLGHPAQEIRIRYFPIVHEGDYAKLWLAAAPKELIANFEEAFAAKGCHLGFIASPSMVLHSLLAKKGMLKSDGLELILNITEKSVTFLFVRNSEPVFFRTKELRAGEYIEDRLAQEVRLTLAFQREKLGDEGLKRVFYRITKAGLLFPSEEFEIETEVIPLNGFSAEDDVKGFPRHISLPLLASLEEY
jgi:hypothetical protein